MVDPRIAKKVRRNCLNGHPLPAGLAALWAAKLAADEFLSDTLGMELLTSLESLEPGFGEAIADGDPAILANVRAHRRIFGRLGFFAGCDEWWLAFDFASDAADPPVVRLDTEGQYRWQGATLGEAIARVGADLQVGDDTREWLSDHGFTLSAPGEFGASTQFLPSIADLHERAFEAESGTPKPSRPTAKRQAQPDDPMTWMLRPAAEVRAALATLLKLPPGARPPRQWVQCDGEGRVATLWFHPVPQTRSISVANAKFGMSPAQR